MLSDNEEKVIDALRLVASAQREIQKTAAQEDMRKELEAIFNDLNEYDHAYDKSALIDEVRRRIYNLLY